MTVPTILGVDPGMTSCGIVVRQAGTLLAHTTAARAAGTSRADWADQCLTAALNLCDPLNPPDVLAVEDVTTPHAWHNGRKQIIDPTSCIETAIIAGAVAGWAWADNLATVWVPPGGNGSAPKQAYPPELWGPREGPAGTGQLRHCRSAWDVAGIAQLIARGRVVA